MKVETLKTILRVSNSASKDATRYNIKGVYVDIHNEALNQYGIIATDGHKLVKVIVTDEDLAKISKRIISSDSLAGLKSFLKLVPKHSQDISFEPIAENNSLVYKFMIGGQFVLVLDTQAKYPNYESIMPKQENTIEIAFDVALLMDLVKSIDSKHTLVKLSFDSQDKLKPIFCSNSKLEGMAILMPCRM